MKRMIRPKTGVEMLQDFEDKLNSMRRNEEIESCDSIEASYDAEDYEDESGWELIDSKSVYDFDGFLTDYSLWHNYATDEWITIFGDNDMYDPSNKEADMEFGSNEDEARDWFAEYQGDAGDDW